MELMMETNKRAFTTPHLRKSEVIPNGMGVPFPSPSLLTGRDSTNLPKYNCLISIKNI
jgi:hypothetical protein